MKFNYHKRNVRIRNRKISWLGWMMFIGSLDEAVNNWFGVKNDIT